MPDIELPRSWLFAPGHDEKLLGKVFDVGADAVLLDLEDAVPAALKDRARDMVAEVAWVAERAPGIHLDCTVESARGVFMAFEIASAPACTLLSFGALDLAADLGSSAGEQETLYARSHLVIAARSAGKPRPSDGVHPLLNDDEGLRKEAEAAKRLGFFGKSAIHPRQVPIIHEVFTPTPEELAWAKEVLWAFEQSGGAATKTAAGEFVDRPVAERAKQQLRAGRETLPPRLQEQRAEALDDARPS